MALYIVGVLYLDECPVQHFIPIYLIVIGAFSLCMNILSMLVSIHQRRNPECETTGLNKFYNYANCVFCCFLLAWFIAGEYSLLLLVEPLVFVSGGAFCS